MSDQNKNTEQNINVNDDSNNVDFPEVEEMTSLLGGGFEMPQITKENPESAPTAEPEPIEDPETGDSYLEDDEPRKSAHSEEVDKKGRKFDPQIFATDENGNPRYNKRGLFIFLRKDKRGKVDTTNITKAENFESALLYFDAFTDSAASLLGDHWKPTNDEQRKAVAKSIARYLDSTDFDPLTPAQAMLLKLGTYSAPRITHRDTVANLRLKIVGFWIGAKDFWASLTGNKRTNNQKPEPRPIAQEIKTDGIHIDPNSL